MPNGREEIETARDRDPRTREQKKSSANSRRATRGETRASQRRSLEKNLNLSAQDQSNLIMDTNQQGSCLSPRQNFRDEDEAYQSKIETGVLLNRLPQEIQNLHLFWVPRTSVLSIQLFNSSISAFRMSSSQILTGNKACPRRIPQIFVMFEIPICQEVKVISQIATVIEIVLPGYECHVGVTCSMWLK